MATGYFCDCCGKQIYTQSDIHGIEFNPPDEKYISKSKDVCASCYSYLLQWSPNYTPTTNINIDLTKNIDSQRPDDKEPF